MSAACWDDGAEISLRLQRDMDVPERCAEPRQPSNATSPALSLYRCDRRPHRCRQRYKTLFLAMRACEAAAWCGGVSQDSGLQCSGKNSERDHRFELRSGVADGAQRLANGQMVFSRRLVRGSNRGSAACETRRALFRAQHQNMRPTGRGATPARASRPSGRPSPRADPRSKPPTPAQIAEARSEMGRLGAARAFPLELRLRDALAQSVQLRRAGLLHWQRHPPSPRPGARPGAGPGARRSARDSAAAEHEAVVGMGSLYPLYSLGALRNLAAHVFDAGDPPWAALASPPAANDERDGGVDGAAAAGTNATAEACAARARAVRPCDVVFASFASSFASSSVRPRNGGNGNGGGGGDDGGGGVAWFAAHVHPFIASPYLLISDGGTGGSFAGGGGGFPGVGGGGIGGAGGAGGVGASRLRATRAVVAMLSGSSLLRSWWAARTQLPAASVAPFDQRVRILPAGVLGGGASGGKRRSGSSGAAPPLNATKLIEAALRAQAAPKTGWLLLPVVASDAGAGGGGTGGGEGGGGEGGGGGAVAAAAELRAAFAGWRGTGGVGLTVASLDANGAADGATGGSAGGGGAGGPAAAAGGLGGGGANQGVPSLALLARHRFVLCATANSALTWATLLAGSTPVVRAPSRAEARLLRPLPVLSVAAWGDVTPVLLRARAADDAAHRRPLYAYETLFADAWAGRVAAARERCLARHRAASRAGSEFTYDYHKRGGWVETRGGRHLPGPMIKTLGNMAKD